MKLEDQVCSLDLAKRLKELGVKQESLHFWQWVEAHQDYEIDNGSYDNKISAFTVAEMGEMLRKTRFNLPVPLEFWDWDWSFKLTDQAEGYGTEADARARMLICLIEQKRLSVEQISARRLG